MDRSRAKGARFSVYDRRQLKARIDKIREGKNWPDGKPVSRTDVLEIAVRGLEVNYSKGDLQPSESLARKLSPPSAHHQG